MYLKFYESVIKRKYLIFVAKLDISIDLRVYSRDLCYHSDHLPY